jgi:glycosyltransferase XagB
VERVEPAQEAGGLDEETLLRLLDDAGDNAAELAEMLVGRGHVAPGRAVAALANLHGLRVIRPAEERADPDVLAAMDPSVARPRGWLPLRREHGHLLVATTRLPDLVLELEISERFPADDVEYALTSEVDLFEGIMAHLGPALVEGAVHGLERTRPELSAAQTFTQPQIVFAAVALVALIEFTIIAPLATYVAIVAIASVFYTANILFRFFVSMAGARYEKYEAVTHAEMTELAPSELPVYTLLIPVFREGRVVGQLIDNLAALDYPPEKLDVLFLLEENDPETIAAARAAHLTPSMRLVVVPQAVPQTKPKACNVGLALARGDLIVIYDAEDRPDPDQLRKAAVLFRRAGERLVCVQAELNYWNADENPLTRLFTLEYSYWFDYMLQGLSHTRLPIPLGGTSNHFRTGALRRLGGWDPHNVTEDADLGIRAAALGFQVRTVQSTTWEEACGHYGAWIKQRSRWIKGYMQTTLIHLRHPGRLLKGAGLVQSLGFGLLVGGTPVTFLIAPVLWVLFLLSLALRLTLLRDVVLPEWLSALTLLDLVLGNATMIYLSMMGGFRRRRYGLVVWALLNPLYWCLHSIAAYKALWQLLLRPHYWEKTEHGVTRQTEAATSRVMEST